MALPIEKLGTTYDERTDTIDPERAKAYAAATNDDNPAYESGKYAPPVFGVVPTWEAMRPRRGRRHPPRGADDHRARRAGHALPPAARAGHDAHDRGRGATACASAAPAPASRPASSSDDADGKPVLESIITMFIRGMSDGESGGPDKPDHTFPADRGEPVASSPCTSTTTRPTATATRRATRCRSTSTTTSPRASGCPASSPTASARWP